MQKKVSPIFRYSCDLCSPDDMDSGTFDVGLMAFAS
ncbi:MAG: hypothetical protein ACJA08_000329 [Cyclobacteriaceae bacterium]|jgi:hypothetical protein